ncbi:hypothetical protein GA0115253_1046111 [Streptomyces sp. Termitarium-T10T-6]|nr:hypothetical protein GA0115253_1046111 [Streptomyces sp. Termitarium-T10T-6]
MPDQQLSDAELAAQPAAYWTGVAYEALIAYTRERQAEKGYTQPQFWLLRNLSAAPRPQAQRPRDPRRAPRGDPRRGLRHHREGAAAVGA